MENQLYAKIFKWLSLALLLVSVCFVVYGFVKGWPQLGQEDNGTVTALITWTYIMIGIALVAIFGFALVTRAMVNPKFLVTAAIVAVGAAAVIGIAVLLAPGTQPLNYDKVVSDGDLLLTETVLNLTYILGGAAVLAIIVGEIVSSIKGKKA